MNSARKMASLSDCEPLMHFCTVYLTTADISMNWKKHSTDS